MVWYYYNYMGGNPSPRAQGALRVGVWQVWYTYCLQKYCTKLHAHA